MTIFLLIFYKQNQEGKEEVGYQTLKSSGDGMMVVIKHGGVPDGPPVLIRQLDVLFLNQMKHKNG